MDPLEFLLRIFLLLVVLFVILQPVFALLFQRKKEEERYLFEPLETRPEKKKKEVKIKKNLNFHKHPMNRYEKKIPISSLENMSSSEPSLSIKTSKVSRFNRFYSLKEAIVIREILGPPKSMQ